MLWPQVRNKASTCIVLLEDARCKMQDEGNGLKDLEKSLKN